MTNDVQILEGDCRERLKELPGNSVDSIVTDPPYELGFMGKGWDSTGIAYDVGMWAECLRVLKPGGHLLAFSGTRTYHRMAVAIEDAGFEVRDMIEWVYGSGFPKSLNIGKAIDKAAGAEREVVGTYDTKGLQEIKKAGRSSTGKSKAPSFDPLSGVNSCIATITAPATPEAQQWEGWHTALKPAHEPICMARKPFTGAVAANVLEWGTGGINVDGCRVEGQWNGSKRTNSPDKKQVYGEYEKITTEQHPAGRFPANLIHDGSEEVKACFPETGDSARKKHTGGNNFGVGNKDKKTKGPDGPMGFGDSGNASRFFKSIIYQAKASKAERGEGNNHPTVKPKALIAYLIKLVTPPCGTVLDPFGGSGTTAVVCIEEGHPCITIDMMPEHIVIIKNRTANAKRKPQTLFDQ